MRLFFFLSIALILFCGTTTAQNISANLETVDYYGNEIHLYDELDQGKTVLLYIFNAWNQQCWNYHNTHALQTLYEAHGPAGDNTIEIYAVAAEGLEGDPEWGLWNWSTGITYHYINGTELDVADGSNYRPACGEFFQLINNKIWRICPDRTMQLFNAVDADSLAVIAQGCTFATQANEVHLLKTDMDKRANCPDETRSVNAYISNKGTNPITSLTLELQVGGEAIQSYNWTGELMPYQLDTVYFDDIVTNGAPTQVTLTASNPNGQPDTDPGNNTVGHLLAAAEQWDSDSIHVEVFTDGYGHQLYWDIRDDNDSLIATGGNEHVGALNGLSTANDPDTEYNDDTHYSHHVSLAGYADKCITIRALSGGGYGTCCNYGEGYLRFIREGQTIFEFTDFGRRAYGKIQTTFVATDNVPDLTQLKAYPNPTSGQINLSFGLQQATEVGIEVYNIMGQRVFTQPQARYMSGNNDVGLALPTLPNGLYWAVLRTRQGTEAVRFVVAN